jgi:hypothetical protein
MHMAADAPGALQFFSASRASWPAPGLNVAGLVILEFVLVIPSNELFC